MREAGLAGVRRGKTKFTTRRDDEAPRAPDLVDRDFSATAPNELWVCDFTYVRTWRGFCYVAFIEDVFSRMIVGWSLHTHMRTSLVTEALEMALWRRGVPLQGLVHHSDAGSQYTSVLYSERLASHGIAPSIGTVGDAFDNAMAESGIGLYKTELIRRRGPWRNPEQVEIQTLEYIDWFNHRRLHGEIGHVPPAELEDAYEALHRPADVPTPPAATALRPSHRLVIGSDPHIGTDPRPEKHGEPLRSPRPPTGRRSTNEDRLSTEVPSLPDGGP